MSDVLNYVCSFAFFASVLRVTTPILFATLGSIVAERAGASNIALEATMLFAALFGALGSGLSGSLAVGFLCAVLGGLLVTVMLCVFALRLKADIILTGIALNLLAGGGTVFIMYMFLQDKGSTSSIATKVFPSVTIPGVSSIPVLGQILSGHNVLTYVAFLMVAVVWVLLFRTRLGAHIRAVGENPGAAASVGINVVRTQNIALLLSGFLTSLGGAFMSMGYMNGFSQNMVAGRGFIALAAASMGQLHPVLGMVAALIFGAADAFSNAMAAMRIPDELVKLIPYATTIVGMVVFSAADQRRRLARKKQAMEQS
ncbi:ABC transporter permease [uncultured Oscillibacter sp.]|uniref:ABC transporter permease n=1 Tax=uncultured Oscillibacter sp. TaxID=876091 RepID=UPI00280543E2|nr:ABC transporter permease [uncultured Oscillibacter sp.]